MIVDIEKFKIDRNKKELSKEEIEYLNTLSNDEIKQLIEYHDKNGNYYNAIQDAIKLILNSVYGGFGNNYFVCSNKDIAGAITAMGQDGIKFADKIAEEYTYNYWHLDEELHAKLGVKTEDVEPIDSRWIHRESKTIYDGQPTREEIDEGIYQRNVPVCLYIDTDSIDKNSVIRTDKGIMTVEDMYKYSERFGSNGNTLTGHESVKSELKVLNWSKEKGMYYANIKRVIKHKVNKSKYRLKTKSGKSVYVTADHSLIVFRDNKQTVVKPNEIIKGDMILEII